MKKIHISIIKCPAEFPNGVRTIWVGSTWLGKRLASFLNWINNRARGVIESDTKRNISHKDVTEGLCDMTDQPSDQKEVEDVR